MINPKKLPLGTDDFKEIRENDYYFVDKTPMIEELVTRGAKVTLFPRPRRFGKSLNMSMLRYFFEKVPQSNAHLFRGLVVEKNEKVMKHQGLYPLIFLSFKDAKQATFEECLKAIQGQILQEFERHRQEVFLSLSDRDQKDFDAIIGKSSDMFLWKGSLKNLSTYLHKHHQKPPVILIDEYDAPIHAGFLNGFYDPVIDFMRTFLGTALKGNLDLHLGVLTGILRVAKESIFSGLNNLDVCSILSPQYQRAFGFFEEDVKNLLTHYSYGPEKLQEMKDWYNGYRVGRLEARVFNPWSILECVQNDGLIQPYWIHSSDNLLIQEIIAKTPGSFKADLETLLKGETIFIIYDEVIPFEHIFQYPHVTANFFLQTGYLSFESMNLENEQTLELRIPNREVLSFFQKTVKIWLNNSLDMEHYHNMLQDLTSGDVKSFRRVFTQTVGSAMSMFDVSGREPERFYHAFVLGMLVSLSKTHEVKSNRESGSGRYDVMLIPRDISKLGVILEFKKVYGDTDKEFEEIAQEAIEQIQDRGYAQELRNRGIQKILSLGIAMRGKKVLIKQG